MPKKIPLRMCVGCNELKPKKELIRLVKSKEGDISIDLTGKKAGRGCYICQDKQCFEKAKKQKRFNKAFKSDISDEIYNQLLEELDDE